jgi:hypothetical protein
MFWVKWMSLNREANLILASFLCIRVYELAEPDEAELLHSIELSNEGTITSNESVGSFCQ